MKAVPHFLSISAKSNYSNKDDLKVLVDGYLESLDYKLNSPDDNLAKSYAFHPINAFHLMKRTSTLMPKIQSILKQSSAGAESVEVGPVFVKALKRFTKTTLRPAVI